MTSDTRAAGRGTPDDSARGRLIAALAAALVGHDAPELCLVRQWLDTWSGLGLVIAGMARRDFDVELRGFPQGWRATFYPSGLAHSIVCGTGWAASPWRATQRAAWSALARESRRGR